MTAIYEKTETKCSTQHNYGIDLVKILATLMVVILHILGKGGVLDACDDGTVQCEVAWFLEVACYCAVNCFAMITGYLMIDRSFRYSRLIDIWLQVVFYAFVINTLMLNVKPAIITNLYWLKAVFPITFKSNWYFSAYAAVFISGPFLNFLINRLPKEKFALLTFGGIGLLSILTVLSLGEDPFALTSGYGAFWLIMMYFAGAYLKRMKPYNLSKYVFLAGYFFCVVLTLLSPKYMTFITRRVFGTPAYTNILIKYTSPLVVSMSICLMMFFIQVKIPSKTQKMVAGISKKTFAVYIIHITPAFLNGILDGAFAFLAWQHPALLVVKVLLIAILFFCICIAIETVRLYLFKLTRMNVLSNKIGNWLDRRLVDGI